jgi:hypothetical protein
LFDLKILVQIFQQCLKLDFFNKRLLFKEDFLKNFFIFSIFISLLFVFFNFILNKTLPIFFFFGLFFFLTTALSFLFLSYLGLYGVFILNFVSLFLFWVSLLFYIKEIFKNQKFYKIVVSK